MLTPKRHSFRLLSLLNVGTDECKVSIVCKNIKTDVAENRKDMGRFAWNICGFEIDAIL